jgi:hypothetical protein
MAGMDTFALFAGYGFENAHIIADVPSTDDLTPTIRLRDHLPAEPAVQIPRQTVTYVRYPLAYQVGKLTEHTTNTATSQIG